LVKFDRRFLLVCAFEDRRTFLSTLFVQHNFFFRFLLTSFFDQFSLRFYLKSPICTSKGNLFFLLRVTFELSFNWKFMICHWAILLDWKYQLIFSSWNRLIFWIVLTWLFFMFLVDSNQVASFNLMIGQWVLFLGLTLHNQITCCNVQWSVFGSVKDNWFRLLACVKTDKKYRKNYITNNNESLERNQLLTNRKIHYQYGFLGWIFLTMIKIYFK